MFCFICWAAGSPLPVRQANWDEVVVVLWGSGTPCFDKAAPRQTRGLQSPHGHQLEWRARALAHALPRERRRRGGLPLHQLAQSCKLVCRFCKAHGQNSEDTALLGQALSGLSDLNVNSNAKPGQLCMVKLSCRVGWQKCDPQC